MRWNPFRPLEEDEVRTYELMKASLAPIAYLGQAIVCNDYRIDREMQRTVNYTGIPQNNVRAREAAMTDSMGVIVDRLREHLAAPRTWPSSACAGASSWRPVSLRKA